MSFIFVSIRNNQNTQVSELSTDGSFSVAALSHVKVQSCPPLINSEVLLDAVRWSGVWEGQITGKERKGGMERVRKEGREKLN